MLRQWDFTRDWKKFTLALLVIRASDARDKFQVWMQKKVETSQELQKLSYTSYLENQV